VGASFLPLLWRLFFGFWFLQAVAGGLVCMCFRWHPRYAFGLLVLPLCGAAPTFLCRRKEK
jgi:hypothetical protein